MFYYKYVSNIVLYLHRTDKDNTYNLNYKNNSINFDSHVLLSQAKHPHPFTVHNTVAGISLTLGVMEMFFAVSSSKLEEQDDSQSFCHKPETEDRELLNMFVCLICSCFTVNCTTLIVALLHLHYI